MPEYDARAARDRDSGLRKVSRVTWRAGAAGVAFAAVIGVALTHHADAAITERQQQQPQQQRQRPQQPRPRQRHQHQRHRQPGSILIPAQPPRQSSGNGQVTSGAS